MSFQNLVVKFINLLQLNRRVNVSQQLTTPNVGPFKIQGENCRGSFFNVQKNSVKQHNEGPAFEFFLDVSDSHFVIPALQIHAFCHFLLASQPLLWGHEWGKKSVSDLIRCLNDILK